MGESSESSCCTLFYCPFKQQVTPYLIIILASCYEKTRLGVGLQTPESFIQHVFRFLKHSPVHICALILLPDERNQI